MRFQYDYVGGAVPQNLGVLVCPKCEDALDEANRLLILPPDPLPFRNTRPENYMVDETGPTQALAAVINTGESEIGASFYLDLYDGDPDADGESALATLTGSATRTNYAAVMTTDGLIATNTAAITITTEAEAGAFVAWAVIFDAASGGSIVMDGPLTIPQTVTMWNGASFAAGALQVWLTATGLEGQWDFSNPLQSGELLTCGIC